METPSDRSALRVTAISVGLVTALFAILVWHHRWISDDGLIYVRAVRMILAGHGPVFNAAERAESNTSVLWPWMVAAVAAITRGDPARITVWLGGLLSVAGVAIAMDATRRWHRARGARGPIVPAGALLVLAIVPFWDFGTSGLESGLTLLWIAGAWATLVALVTACDGPGATPRRQRWTALVLGLGPLVRPDLAVVSLGFLAAGAWLIRPSWRRALGLAAIAGVLPVGYEIFRAGYYGALVPLPALAKSATGSSWGRGLQYLRDTIQTYLTWFPLGALLVFGVAALRRGEVRGRGRALVIAPLASGLVIGLFVTRVGGDFMHGRMLLPPLFLLVLPVAVLPWSRVTAPVVAAISIWVVVAIVVVPADFLPHWGIQNERLGYVIYVGDPHPIDERAYIVANLPIAGRAYLAQVTGAHRLLTEGGLDVPSGPGSIAPVVMLAGRLGVGGIVTPLDGFVGDTLGLANPLGARIPVTLTRIAGHEKQLPLSWLYTDAGALDPASVGATAAEIEAARHARSCGALAELMASVREPMSASRFWRNLTGAIARTRLAIPANPFVAERTFCDRPLDPNLALGARVTSSSSYQASGWSLASVVDGVRASSPTQPGFSSALGNPASHEERVELDLPAPVTFSKVVLHPTFDHGFPIDFSIQVERDHRWVDVVHKTDYPEPPQTPQVFALAEPVTADRIRIDATRLRGAPSGYLLQLAELELAP